MTELDDIARRYACGEYDHIRRDLELFIVAHRPKIESFRAARALKTRQPVPSAAAITMYILKHASINPASEIREQLEEIQREKWIRGVQLGCPPDEQEVALEWVKTHSAAWREHRVTIIVYCFNKEKERYVALFEDGRP